MSELYVAIYRGERQPGRRFTLAEWTEIQNLRKGNCETLTQETCGFKEDKCVWSGSSCKEKSTVLPADCHLLEQHPCQEMLNICQYVPPLPGSPEGHCEAISKRRSADSVYDTCLLILGEVHRATLPTLLQFDRISTELESWAKTAGDHPGNAPILESAGAHVPPTVRLCSIVFNRISLPSVEFLNGSSTTGGEVITREALDAWWETNAPRNDTTVHIQWRPL